ncbi:MAG: TonB-dependent receptor [Prevotellaceae bacterium]|nr:TonB-dependent receptor [Prevotellaceae bacterium]
MFCAIGFAQVNVSGTVVDSSGEALIGASVVVKGNASLGVVTNLDGQYSLKVPSESTVLVFSYVGMDTKEVKVGKQRKINVTLRENSQLDEVIVVGYGQQKKASVVGAITQAAGKVLERSVGVPDVGTALTGNLPGVITTASSGMPGDEEPQIIIRGSSTWNNAAPLILVDGIERPMSSVDMSSVENISVLKDASATAVYGVKGANGVILITTKRGAEGKAKINASFNATMKVVSKLPNKLDSYDALIARNNAIENELSLSPGSWANMKPMSFIENYRNQGDDIAMQERYPNVDWQDVMFKKNAMSYNANVNVSGGTQTVRYFASVDFQKEGDLYKEYDNGRGYDGGYDYNRVNVRSNLDFNITKSTVLKLNIAGMSGRKSNPWNLNADTDYFIARNWASVYSAAPDVFMPIYSDGSIGYYPADPNVPNSITMLVQGGHKTNTTTRINTDVIVEQGLDFVTKGLNFRGMISWDNTFMDVDYGIEDAYNDPQFTYIDPETGAVNHKTSYDATARFDYSQPIAWVTHAGNVNNYATQRNLNYQLQLNWGRKFGLHDVTAMGLFARQEYATGAEIPHYREDWVFRLTYNFAGRYFAEYNGAYNGSEKFSEDNRFAFFNSGALGWLVSEEKFWKPISKYVDMLKIRASYGEIGDDNVYGRWLYANQWAYGGNTSLDLNQGTSPYTWYREASVGNPNVKWEKVKKLNIGADFSLFGGLFVGNVDFFRDKRVDILIGGDSRAVPSYYGQSAPTVNFGEVTTTGYELALRFNKVLANKMRFWAEMNMTHAKNKIDKYDDPGMYPTYRKQAGYAIGQNRAWIDNGFIQNYDEVYGSPKHDSNDGMKLPGDYYIVDFNGDGVIDDNDQAPYGYSSNPENTYNATLGWEWKGWSVFFQFYGVSNVTREVALTDFQYNLNAVFDTGTWWSKDTPNADVPTSRFATTPSHANGTRYLYDGSYIRLKNAEVAYTFSQKWMKNAGIDYLRLSLSGNNLWLWTKMPDDREVNQFTSGSLGAYPTVKRINLGLKIGF